MTDLTLAGEPRLRNRMMPWRYPRDEMPSRWTLAKWRMAAIRVARQSGYVTACGICKRPVNFYGFFDLRHPRSYGKARRRRICVACADLLVATLDVLEWFGTCDNMPPDVWRPQATPEEVAAIMRHDKDPAASEPNWGPKP